MLAEIEEEIDEALEDGGEISETYPTANMFIKTVLQGSISAQPPISAHSIAVPSDSQPTAPTIPMVTKGSKKLVRRFFKKQNYANEIAFGILFDTGFTPSELLSLRGNDVRTVKGYFIELIPESSGMMAQILAMSSAVAGAADAEWETLEERHRAQKMN